MTVTQWILRPAWRGDPIESAVPHFMPGRRIEGTLHAHEDAVLRRFDLGEVRQSGLIVPVPVDGAVGLAGEMLVDRVVADTHPYR
jgi:hypothetical protein